VKGRNCFAFWYTIAGTMDRKGVEIERGISVLDPTCGSGAFLFAALRILETLYSDCLERMDRFVEDMSDKPHHPEQYSDFKKVLAQIEQHPNECYFILKSVIINNLFGVDIMEEAVEICKLRLFLKLVAQVERVEQIEPLPDIDFNIRAGNTLVGFSSLEQVRISQKGKLGFWEDDIKRIGEDTEMVERAFWQFRAQQTTRGGKITHEDKQELRTRLAKLNAELDRYLAGEYGVVTDNYRSQALYQDTFFSWKTSHQPFHWFVEFYSIMHAGGFDVIIGNPPYVDYSKVRDTYRVLEKDYSTLESGNLYALITERTIPLSEGRYGFILPLSSTNANGNSSLQEFIRKSPSLHVSHYAVRPSKLFTGVDMNLTIVLGARRGAQSHNTTSFNRWPSAFRENLFSTLQYATHDISAKKCAFPKFGNSLEPSIWKKLNTVKERISTYTVEHPSRCLAFHGFGRYWRKCILEALSDNYQEFSVASRLAPFVICLLNSQLSYWYWISSSDCYRFTKTDALNLTVPSGAEGQEFTRLSKDLLESYEANSVVQEKIARNMQVTKEKQFFPALSKDIIDNIDKVLAQEYGFTEEELDFIINYDIKYRMGGVQSVEDVE